MLPSYNFSQPVSKWLLLGISFPASLMLVWSVLQLTPWLSVNIYWEISHISAPWLATTLNPGTTLAQISYVLGLAAIAYSVFRYAQGIPSMAVKLVAVIITCTAVYGLIVFAIGTESVLWLPKTAYQGSLTGTFINRNSFATFLGLGILANLAIAMSRIGEISSRLETRQRLRAFWYLVLRPRWPWLAAALVCLIALVLTNSRAGIAASFCGMLVLFGSLATMRPAVRLPLGSIIAMVFVIALIIFASLGGDLGRRLGRVGDDAALRGLLLTFSQDLINQAPVTGTGLGTYSLAFSTVRTPEFLGEMYSNTEHAHNTYIELASELGLPAMALLAISVASLIAAYCQGLLVRRRAIVWPALGVAVLTLVGSHALADFSLSIPAVAIATIILLMVALAQSLPSKLKETPNPRWHTLGLITGSIALIGLGTWQTAANWYAFQSGAVVRALINGEKLDAPTLLTAQDNFTTCLAINPWHPTCGMDLAQSTLGLATTYGLTGSMRGVALVQLNLAEQQYKEALAKSPVNPLAWYRLARIQAYLNGPQSAANALVNSVITGPADPNLAIIRIPLMLTVLPNLDEDDRRMFTNNIRLLWLTEPGRISRELSANPTELPAMAALIGNDPDAAALWKRYLPKTPLQNASTATPPLGAAPEKR